MYGMRSVFDNAPSDELVDKSIVKDIKDHQFEVEELSLVKVIDHYSCDVVARDKKGHRSYRVSLEKSLKFAHLYKIKNIKGQKIASDYQWREL